MTSPLKEWRGNRPQHEAARLLDTDAMTYSRWERGIHLPRKSKLPEIEEKTGISLEQLLKFAIGGGCQ
jgi:transcriptional regulator with XRE-family HTH domain